MPKSDDKGPQNIPPGSASSGVTAGALAAAALERACRDHTYDRDGRLGLYLDSVEGLARGLGMELTVLSDRIDESPGVGSAGAALVSAALRAADLATLATCALPELPPESAVYLRTAATARLAAASARSLVLEHRALSPSEETTDYVARDLRSVEWRAGLAAQQAEEALQEDS